MKELYFNLLHIIYCYLVNKDKYNILYINLKILSISQIIFKVFLDRGSLQVSKHMETSWLPLVYKII